MMMELLEDIGIEMYNDIGKRVKIFYETYRYGHFHLLQIPISTNYASGSYLVMLKDKDGFRKTFKVVVIE